MRDEPPGAKNPGLTSPGNPAIATCRQLPSSSAADRFIEEAKSQVRPIDANNILYSLESSADYDPQPPLASIKPRVFALNFVDDEFNPAMLGILETLMPSERQVISSSNARA